MEKRTSRHETARNWFGQRALLLSVVGCMTLWGTPCASAMQQASESWGQFATTFCRDCHSGSDAEGGLDLLSMELGSVVATDERWEKIVRQLDSRQMPPSDALRPTESEYRTFTKMLTEQIDRSAEQGFVPEPTATLRRLTRTEYRNAIRDLLGLSVDVEALLPNDEISHGFDNVTVGELSPTLLQRYVTAAQIIGRLAVGVKSDSPGGQTFRMKPDVTQEQHVAGLPLGTRGGMLIPFYFPRTGQYETVVRLARDRNEQVEGLRGSHEMIILLDGKEIERFTIRPPKDGNHGAVDEHLNLRFAATAGEHRLGITFLPKSIDLQETMRQPFDAHFNMHRHPRLSPAVFQVSINGPYGQSHSASSAVRNRILPRMPDADEDEEGYAQEILTKLARLAYRRPVSAEDLTGPMRFYTAAREAGEGVDEAIEAALESILVSPSFLFRVEADPLDAATGSVRRLNDFELATRLAFFLWSSIPDEELLHLAEQGRLAEPQVLEQQTRRMLEDPKSIALVENFARQWLYLGNLESITPDMRLYPDFDDNLRQAFRIETEMFLESIFKGDQSVLRLLDADYTYLNERLAKHYGIPHVYGSRFRRVPLDGMQHRGGLLQHGSILTVTSYATRTSPVIRGHWIMKNLMGTPPPPPPPDVPALDNTVAADLPMRQRLAEHRANPACASCHATMDPIGFALENFDAVGRWRETDAGQVIDASAELPGGVVFDGVTGLQRYLLDRPEVFVRTLTEKLMIFSLGRGLGHSDGPVVRQILRDASQHEYSFAELAVGIVLSEPFRNKRVN